MSCFGTFLSEECSFLPTLRDNLSIPYQGSSMNLEYGTDMNLEGGMDRLFRDDGNDLPFCVVP